MVAIVAVLICVFAISASAAVTPNNEGEVYVTSDNKTLALYDAEGKALAWFKDSSVEFGYVAYRVEIDFTCTLTQSGKEIHTNSPTLHDTDNNPETVFPYSLADMVLLNGRDYASFTQISGAFKGYPLEAVYVNSKFRWINQTTFRESNIRVFDIPKTHTGTIHFGNMCFWKALNLQYIFIPDGATLSGDAQFQHTAIRSLEFGPNCAITAIGRYAFYDCKNLTGNVVIPNTVASIGDYAFALPSNIENNTNSLSIVLPSALSTVGEKFFQNNNSLVSISFTGTSLTAINSPAFENCKRLTAIALPEGLTTLGNCAFKNCTGLTSVTFPSTLSTLNETSHFLNNTSLTTVIGFENTSLTATSLYMFNGCSSLTSISLPVGMKEIAGWTFTDCTDLTSVIIPENSSLEVIRNYAFEDAESLTSVRLPNSLRTLEMGAFNRTYALASVENLENTQLTVITTQAFHGAPLTKLTLPSGLTEIGKDAFKGNKIVQDVLVIPNGVTVIGGWAFAGVENVTRIGKIVLPASLQSFGDNYVFEKTSFSSMVIPAGLAQIKQGVFNKLSTKGVVFYFTGTEAQAKTLQTGAGSNNGAFTGATTADLTTYTNASDKTTKNYIVFGIDPCEAFYGGHAVATVKGEDATCEKNGLTDGSYCSRCQKTLETQETIPSFGHNYKPVVTEPTCQNGGYTTYTCTRCNDTYKDSETNATDHKWNGANCEYNCGATRAAYIGTVSYATFSEAYANANAGDTITLVANITLSEIIKIEKPITLNLGTYTVTSSAKKAFELYADATIINGTIAGACRCIDTRKAVNLTLENVNLIADKYYSEYSNQQPLTIGGNEDGTVVTMNNVTINAGTQGYDITSFVKTTFNATDCTFIGYIGLNVKNGSEESTFNFVNCDFTVDISKNDVKGNATALITVDASSVAVNLDKESTVTLIGNHTYIAYVADIKTVVVTLPSAFASDVVKSEYAVIDNANGTITVACPHAEAVVVNYIYANGYEAKGICVSKCTACDVELTSEAPRLFTFLGYSVPVDGKGEIAIGFEINKEAIAAYESVTGYKLSYGIFAALETIGTKDIFESGSGAITAAVASTSSAFDFKITGIESAEYKALNMAMGAYVIAEKGAEKTVSYMQGGKPEAEAKYIFVSYDLIASNS